MRPIVTEQSHVVYYSNSRYSNKQEAQAHIRRDKLFAHNQMGKVSLSTLAELSLSHTIHPAEYTPSHPTLTQKDVVGTTLLFLDVDNSKAYLPYEAALTILESNFLPPALLYSTHSHTEQHHRYRIIFQLPQSLGPSEYKELCIYISNFLGADSVDPSCFTINHAYYPGKDILYLNDVVLDPSNYTHVIPKESHKAFMGGTRLSLYETKEQEGAWSQSHRLPFHDIIGVPLDTPFPCHLHEEEEGSARIVLLEDGRYMYKCYGNCVFHKPQLTPQEQGLDILGYLQHLYKLDFPGALRKLEDMTGFDIETEFERKKKKDIERSIKYMLSKAFREEQPVVSNFLFKYKSSKWRIYKAMLDYATYYMLNQPIYKRRPNPTFYMSTNMLVTFLEMNGIRTNLQAKAVNKKLNELVYYGFIHKHKDSEIPKSMLLKLKGERSYMSKRFGRTEELYNRKDVYSINPVGIEQFKIIEQNILNAKDNGLRSESISQDGLLAWQGVDYMKDTFVQSRKRHEQSISDPKRAFKSEAKDIIDERLQVNGYAHLGEVKALLEQRGYNKRRIQSWLATMLPSILKDLKLKDQRVNKDLREQLNIPDTVKTGGVILYPKRP